MKSLERIAGFLKTYQQGPSSPTDYVLSASRAFEQIMKSEGAEVHLDSDVQKATKEVYYMVRFYVPLHGRTDNDAFAEGNVIFSVFPEDDIVGFDLRLAAAEDAYAKEEVVHTDGDFPVGTSPEELAEAAHDAVRKALNDLETDVTVAPFDIRMNTQM